MTVTIKKLNQLKLQHKRFASLTCYDASFAAVAAAAQIEVLLIGDTLGMVIQGHRTTLPVSVEDICYHVKAVSRANQYSLLMADMPFMAAHSKNKALEAAMQLMQSGAHMVKLEGGLWLAPLITQLKQQGVPVCAHLGLTPQSMHTLGGYKIQATTEDAADELISTAKALEAAGAEIILVECIPAAVTAKLHNTLQVPIIGIGAGATCDSQILVLYDMLGIPDGKKPKFVKNYLESAPTIQQAIQNYRQDVLQGDYPTKEHSF